MTVCCDNTILADNVALADSFIKRLIGLMGRKCLTDGEGLLLNCSSVHCFFMKFPIDVVYISKDMTVLGTQTLKPWRIGKWIAGTKYVLELRAGASSPVVSGTKISLDCNEQKRSENHGGKA